MKEIENNSEKIIVPLLLFSYILNITPSQRLGLVIYKMEWRSFLVNN
jgi:hypothetical protein